VAKVDRDNERSLRLAKRLGMREVELIEVHGRPHVLLALKRDEALPAINAPVI
jgi:RimJ/RimL family protein N-acetyltransferase